MHGSSATVIRLLNLKAGSIFQPRYVEFKLIVPGIVTPFSSTTAASCGIGATVWARLSGRVVRTTVGLAKVDTHWYLLFLNHALRLDQLKLSHYRATGMLSSVFVATLVVEAPGISQRLTYLRPLLSAILDGAWRSYDLDIGYYVTEAASDGTRLGRIASAIGCP